MCTRCKRIEKKDLKEGTESVRIEGMELRAVDADEMKATSNDVDSRWKRETAKLDDGQLSDVQSADDEKLKDDHQLRDDQLREGHQLNDDQPLKDDQLADERLEENTHIDEQKADDEPADKTESEVTNNVSSENRPEGADYSVDDSNRPNDEATNGDPEAEQQSSQIEN